MPQLGNQIHFKAGLQSAYDAKPHDLNTAYFCTDTQRFFIGDVEYTRPVKHGEELPITYTPPNSFFVVETDSGKELYYSKDGDSWELISYLPSSVSGGVFGINTKTNLELGDSFTVPRFTLDSHGLVTSASNQTLVLPRGNKFEIRVESSVTQNTPEVDPGTFVFDSTTLALYVDLDTGRKQVKDPLKLSLEGGKVKGTIEIVDNLGSTILTLDQGGSIIGKKFQCTGNIHLETSPESVVVIDNEGNFKSRTKEEFLEDLGVKSFGTLTYTPEGTVTAPEVTVNYSTQSVVSSITPGDPTTFEVADESLVLTMGTKTTFNTVDVIKTIDSTDVTTPVFKGKEKKILLN